MAAKIRLEVVTPEGDVVNDEAKIVMAPGSLGEFGVLAGHTPFLTTLKLGTLRYEDASGTERCVFIDGGFAEALPNKVTILAEDAQRRCDIDIAQARSSVERAQKRLEEAKATDLEYTRLRIALEKSLHRLRVAESKMR